MTDYNNYNCRSLKYNFCYNKILHLTNNNTNDNDDDDDNEIKFGIDGDRKTEKYSNDR